MASKGSKASSMDSKASKGSAGRGAGGSAGHGSNNSADKGIAEAGRSFDVHRPGDEHLSRQEQFIRSAGSQYQFARQRSKSRENLGLDGEDPVAQNKMKHVNQKVAVGAVTGTEAAHPAAVKTKETKLREPPKGSSRMPVSHSAKKPHERL